MQLELNSGTGEELKNWDRIMELWMTYSYFIQFKNYLLYVGVAWNKSGKNSEHFHINSDHATETSASATATSHIPPPGRLVDLSLTEFTDAFRIILRYGSSVFGTKLTDRSLLWRCGWFGTVND